MGATIHYYKDLALAAESHGRTLDMVMTHARTARVFEYVEARDRDGLAAYLHSFIVRLQAAGAEFAVVPAVTPHYCIRELIQVFPNSGIEHLRAAASRHCAREIFAVSACLEANR